MISVRRLRKTIYTFAPLLIAAFVWAGQHYGWFDQTSTFLTRDQPGLYAIDRFIDGDTIAVQMNGKTETIRMIGIDTPETHKPNTPVQCYGPAAAAYTQSLIGEQKVRLEADPQSTNRDRYNRLLRYVYLPDGTLLAENLIKNGYGFAYTSFPFNKKADFVAAQSEAQSAKRGLWGNCTPVQQANGRWQTNNAS